MFIVYLHKISYYSLSILGNIVYNIMLDFPYKAYIKKLCYLTKTERFGFVS